MTPLRRMTIGVAMIVLAGSPPAVATTLGDLGDLGDRPVARSSIATTSEATAFVRTNQVVDDATSEVLAMIVLPENTATRWDRRIAHRYNSLGESTVPLAQFAVAADAWCWGGLTGSEVEQLFRETDPRAASAIQRVSSNDCQTQVAVVNGNGPTGAGEWHDMVADRFRRAHSWTDAATFAEHAERLCATGSTPVDVMLDATLSSSEQLELIGMLRSDECTLRS